MRPARVFSDSGYFAGYPVQHRIEMILDRGGAGAGPGAQRGLVFDNEYAAFGLDHAIIAKLP